MHRRFSLLLALLLGPTLAHAATRKVTVEAGDFDRRDTIVTFDLPPIAGHPRALKSEGKFIPLDIALGGQASFILEKMERGNQATYELDDFALLGSRDGISFTRDLTKLHFARDFQKLLDYEAEPGVLPRKDVQPIFARGGYLHPICTPSGRVVTDDFPTNHLHHHGIWWSWTRTEFDGRKPEELSTAPGRTPAPPPVATGGNRC